MTYRKNLRRFLAVATLLAVVAFQKAPQPAQAQIILLGQRGCAPGTSVGGPNLVVNGDFSIDPGPGPGILPEAGFESSIINRGPNTYPADIGDGGFSIQTGPKNYSGDLLIGKPFPGDPQRDTPAVDTYFYSNPLWPAGVTEVLLWRQRVPVVGGTTYNFYAYFDNLINPEKNDADPVIELRVNGIVAGPAYTVSERPDDWIAAQFAFTTAPSQTEVTLEILDLAQNSLGDDFGMTQINLRQCVSGLGLSKHAAFTGRNSDNTIGVEFLFTLKNYGSDPEPLRSLQVTDDLVATFGATSYSVVAISSPTLAVNPAFDGAADKNLLAPGAELAARQTATIKLVLKLPLTANRGPYYNIARALALAGNLEVVDLSTPGTNPSPSDIDNPKADNDATGFFLDSRLWLPLIAKP